MAIERVKSLEKDLEKAKLWHISGSDIVKKVIDIDLQNLKG